MKAARKSKYDVDINTTVEAAIPDALAEFETLGEEMRDWFDNMPESLQGGSKGDEVSEAADALEDLGSVDEVPEAVKALPVQYTERQAKKSRAARNDYACTLLRAAIEQIDHWLDDNVKHADHDDVEQFRDEVQDILDNAEGVTFPGMY